MSITPTDRSARQADLTVGGAPQHEVARKRAMVRAINEQIRLLAQPSGDTDAEMTQADFVCECPHETCFAVVPMTLIEWNAATREADYYVAQPRHVAVGDQAVVATDHYAVARAAWPGE